MNDPKLLVDDDSPTLTFAATPPSPSDRGRWSVGCERRCFVPEGQSLVGLSPRRSRPAPVCAGRRSAPIDSSGYPRGRPW